MTLQTKTESHNGRNDETELEICRGPTTEQRNPYYTKIRSAQCHGLAIGIRQFNYVTSKTLSAPRLHVLLESREHWVRGYEVQSWEISRSIIVRNLDEWDIDPTLSTVSKEYTYIYRDLRPRLIAYRRRLTHAIHIAKTAAIMTPSVLATLTRACSNSGAHLSARRFINAGDAMPLGKGVSGAGFSIKAQRVSLCKYEPGSAPELTSIKRKSMRSGNIATVFHSPV